MTIGVEVFPAPSPVVRWRRGDTVRDGHGNQRGGAWGSSVLAQVSIVPGTATENTTEGFAQLDSSATLYGPASLELTAADEIEYAGHRYKVNGEPQRWADALGTGVGSTVVALRRREG